jgi:ArsR family transcriptional regulator
MESTIMLLKAIATDTRLKIVKLLLKRNYCVGALARRLDLTEAAISQHLKVLHGAGLLVEEKRGYFMHYDVNRGQLRALAKEIEILAEIERKVCNPEDENCMQEKRDKCHVYRSGKECSEEVRFACHSIKQNSK